VEVFLNTVGVVLGVAWAELPLSEGKAGGFRVALLTPGPISDLAFLPSRARFVTGPLPQVFASGAESGIGRFVTKPALIDRICRHAYQILDSAETRMTSGSRQSRCQGGRRRPRHERARN
jgi:hypothetical protein